MIKIGITSNYFTQTRTGCPSVFGSWYLNREYTRYFEGFEVLILTTPFLQTRAQMEEWASLVDGIVFSGGFDIPSNFYMEEKLQDCPGTEDESRALYELGLLKIIDGCKKPIFGICLGTQMFNVHRGGSLWQDLSLQREGCICHSVSNSDTRRFVHEVKTVPDTILSRLCESSFMVNSSHHQGVKTLGKGLKVSALCSNDQSIEALESEDGWFLGVQWHPEGISESENSQKLIHAFVDCCKRKCPWGL